MILYLTIGYFREMSKNLGVLKKETVCNSGGNSMDTRICVLK
ncbi:hypothetical protein GCM10008902_18630 [[Clostridium] innocuum]